jgi:hypothetical protein
MALATVHQSHNDWAHCCPLSTSLCNYTSSLESPRFTCLWYTAFKTNLELQKNTVESNGLFQFPASSSPQMSMKSWQWKPCLDQRQHQDEKTELQCKRYEALWRILTATPNPSHSCLDSKIPLPENPQMHKRIIQIINLTHKPVLCGFKNLLQIPSGYQTGIYRNLF